MSFLDPRVQFHISFAFCQPEYPSQLAFSQKLDINFLFLA